MVFHRFISTINKLTEDRRCVHVLGSMLRVKIVVRGSRTVLAHIRRALTSDDKTVQLLLS